MTAIAGLWRFDAASSPVGDCARMLAAQQIYGPHDVGQWSDGPISLGRRLYRTLPEDAHDRQPLHSRDGRLTLVADVRLDNRDELAALLDLTPSESRQHCDAAILLGCLDHWGEAALDRLVGDFAFALWNAQAQSLTLARDCLGQRPLHYHRGRGFFAFASMPKGLHAVAEIPFAPDEKMAAEFLTSIPPQGPRTFFQGIARVEPGHLVVVTRDGVASRRYWQPRRRPSPAKNLGDYVEGLRENLDRATQSRLRGANGAVGAHLSGGLDSGAVTATAARLLAPTGGKVVAFTAVPQEGHDGAELRNRFSDEGPLAAATAAMYQNVEHVLVRSQRPSPLAGLDRNYFLYDRPFLNLCNDGWLTAINQVARDRKLSVLLIGQMGNLTLSYAGIEYLSELLRGGHFIKLWQVASELVGKSNIHWRGILAQLFAPYVSPRLWQWANETFLGQNPDIRAAAALRAERIAELDQLARERHFDFTNRPFTDSFAMRLKLLQRADNGNVNKGVLAGWGIDRRDPTADKRLVEYCLSVPAEAYLAGGAQRGLARSALADRLPQAVLNEERKGYQAADWHEGLTAARTEVAAELERLAACPPAARLLDIERLKRLVEEWPSSGWEHPDIRQSYRLALLRGISAGSFLRKASGSNR